MGKQNSSINILLADDDEDDRELFADIIHQVNGPIKLVCTTNGSELIDKLKDLSNNNLPDLLFLDLNMPGKDGRECLSEMKGSETFRQLRIIICSTSSSPDDINYAFDKGADLYLIKPPRFNTYFNLLQKILNLFAEEKLPVRDRHKFVFS
jgi:CheY-like chemotaxis protein